MLTKIYYPISNIDSLTFESNIEMSVNDYDKKVLECYNDNRKIMEYFYKNGFSIKENDLCDNVTEPVNINDNFQYGEAEALIFDYNKRKVDYSFFNDIINSQKMCILEININPNSLDYDVESDIKMWIGESTNINNDIRLDNKTKLLSLQGKNIDVDVDNLGRVKLVNCKILQNKSNINSPLNIIIIVEKITL